MILPINHGVDWRYIRQRKKTQIDKDVANENTNKIDHNYRVWDKVMTKMSLANKYETLFRGPYEIVQTWENGTFTLQTGAVTQRINIYNIEPYNDAGIE